MPQGRLELQPQHHGPLQTSTELTLPPLTMHGPLSHSPCLASLVRLITKMTWLPLLLASDLGLTFLHSVYLAEKSQTYIWQCLLFRSSVLGKQSNVAGTHS